MPREEAHVRTEDRVWLSNRGYEAVADACSEFPWATLRLPRNGGSMVGASSDSLTVEEILDRIRARVESRKHGVNGEATPVEADTSAPEATDLTLETYDLSELRHHIAWNNKLWDAPAAINPRPPGLHNELAQLAKKAIRRLLSWHLRSLLEFNRSVTHSVNEISKILESLQNSELATRKQLQATQQGLEDTQTNQQAALASLGKRIEQLEQTVPTQGRNLQQALEDTRTKLTGQVQNLRKDALSLADSHSGPRAKKGLWFNEPIIVVYDEKGEASWGGTHERVIEKAWVLRHLGRVPLGTRILDLGCAESLLPIELASNGYLVTGVDTRFYPLEHPNFMFVRTDICNSQLETGSFDVVIAMSTIEHVGLGYYGDPTTNSSDRSALREIFRFLRPGGSLLITVPYGRRAHLPLHRVYDRRSLQTLLRGFQIVKLEFGIKINEKTWKLSSSEKQAAAQVHDRVSNLPSAVAMALCVKPRGKKTLIGRRPAQSLRKTAVS